MARNDKILAQGPIGNRGKFSKISKTGGNNARNDEKITKTHQNAKRSNEGTRFPIGRAGQSGGGIRKRKCDS